MSAIKLKLVKHTGKEETRCNKCYFNVIIEKEKRCAFDFDFDCRWEITTCDSKFNENYAYWSK